MRPRRATHRIVASVAVAASAVVGVQHFTPLLATAFAQSAQNTGETTRQLDARRQQLRDAEQRMQDTQRSVQELTREREQLNAELIALGQRIQSSEARLNEVEARLAQLAVEERSVRGSLASEHDRISVLLAAMQRMGRNPPPVIITKREDALEMVRSAMLLARAFPEMKQQAEALAGQLGELVRVMAEEQAEREKQKAETTRLIEDRTRLAGLIESKKQSLAERNRELQDLRKAVADLQRDTGNLTETLALLDKKVAERTGLGDYDAELRAREALKAPQDAPGRPPVDAPAGASPPSSQPSAVVLAPRTDVAALNPGRLKPSIPFASAKARLPMPAVGKRVLGFGEKTQFGGQSKGLVLETRHSAQVTSPADGWVIYAGAFRSYGQLLIINPGNGYHILLAGMHQIDVQLGQFVLASEPVGTMAPPARPGSQDNAPVLYVEFRKDGRPIDPDPWWADIAQRVQG